MVVIGEVEERQILSQTSLATMEGSRGTGRIEFIMAGLYAGNERQAEQYREGTKSRGHTSNYQPLIEC